MRNESNTGWRSHASRLRSAVRHQATAPAPAAAPTTGHPAGGWWAPSGETPVVGQPWEGVQWSLLFVAFLAYIWVVVTYSVAIGDVAMVLALGGLVIQRERFRMPAFMLAFAGYVAWSALGYFSSAYPATVLDWSITLLKLWLIALVAVNALSTPQRLRFFIFFFLGAFALYPLRGAFINFFLASYSVAGRAIWNYIYANPNDLAALTLLPTAMVAALLVREPRGWPRLAALAGAVFLPLLILMTQSRGGLLALGVVVVLGLAGQRGNAQRLRALLTVALVCAAVLPFAPSGVWERLGGLVKATDTEALDEVDEEGSAEGRYGIWRVATVLAAENPVTGVGIGAYPQAHARQAARMPNLPRGSLGLRDTHSTYLNLLAELGWPGLVLFLAMIAATLGFAERIRRRARAMLPQSCRQLLFLELGVLGFLLAGIFGSYGKLAFTFIFLSVVWAKARLIEEELAGQMAAARPGPAAYTGTGGGGRSLARAR